MVRTRPCRYQCSLPVKFLNSALESLLPPVMVSAFLVWLWIAAAAATLASPRSGVASGKGLLGRPSKTTACSRSFRAKRRLLFTAEAPWSARGLALSHLGGGSRAKGLLSEGGHSSPLLKWPSDQAGLSATTATQIAKPSQDVAIRINATA